MKNKALLLLLFATFNLSAQYINNTEFEWTVISKCLPNDACLALNYGVQNSPILNSACDCTIDTYLAQVVESLELDDDVNGVLKLKIFIQHDNEICLMSIGERNIKLSNDALKSMEEKIESLDIVSLGEIRDITVNNIGYLYVEIQNGVLDKYKCVNFALI